MALVVEDGNGLANADAYISLGDATAYFNKFGEPTGWEEAYLYLRETAIVIGTRYIDDTYGLRWLGQKVLRTQSLAWPRYGIRDESGYLLDSNVLPLKLTYATCEAALEYIKRKATGGLRPTQEDTGTIRRERVQLGEFSEEFEYMAPKGRSIRIPKVEQYLAEYVVGSINVPLWLG